MPIYEYACEACGAEFEVEQRISEPALERHVGGCNGPVRKLISRSTFTLKGNGWYSDHYGLKSGSSASTGSSAPAASSSSKSTAGSGTSTAGSGTTSGGSDASTGGSGTAASGTSASSTSGSKSGGSAGKGDTKAA